MAFTPSNPNDLALVPYAKVGEEWTLHDKVVLEFGMRAHMSGVLESVFIDGNVRSPLQLLQMMQSPDNVPVFVFKDSVAVGLAWLNGCSGSHAFGHFMFLKGGRGELARRAGKLILEYWGSFRVGDAPLFSVILGVVPGLNVKALKYVQDIGFTWVGSIPKMLSGRTAELVYLNPR